MNSQEPYDSPIEYILSSTPYISPAAHISVFDSSHLLVYEVWAPP